MHGDGFIAGIAEDDFVNTLASRVAVESRFGVGGQ